MDKKSFVIYKNWAEIIKRLPVEDAGELIQAVCNYQTGTEYTISSPIIEALFEGQIKPQLESDAEQYQKKCERIAEVNRKRNEESSNEVVTKSSRSRHDIVGDTDTDTVTDTVTDKDNKKHIPQGKPADARHRYGDYSHVLLSDNEILKLNDEYGIEKTHEAIKYLDEYIEYKGYKCKNYYLAMKKWVFDAIKERPSKPPDDDFLLRIINGGKT